MRGPAEIAFRLRQEFHNLRGFLLPPAMPHAASGCRMAEILPDGTAAVAALKNTRYAAALVAQADRILAHDFPVLGRSVATGGEIRWDRDYFNNREWTGSAMLRLIPYLDADKVGDHKFVWELNRHQHLVLLAQAWLLTGRREYITEIETQVIGWIVQHPYGRGMQWVSALEVGFRALSWLWVWRLVQGELSEDCRRALLEAIWLHGLFLRRNLSIYFSPNTHLLGEAVALHAIGRLFPELPHAKEWRRIGAGIVAGQMDRQIRADGSHFEQSSYYHVYACDFFLFHALLEDCSAGYRSKLRHAGSYLWDLLGPAGRIPFLGDDDGGRLFHPYGDRPAFGQATLAALGAYLAESEWRGSIDATAEIAVWWMGAPVLDRVAEHWRPRACNAAYRDAGVVTLWDGERRQVILDVRGFGAAPHGHSHAHALSLIVREGEHELLTDPGTYSYAGNSNWRATFRSTAMHNTIAVDGCEQARPEGLFRWGDPPAWEIVAVGPHSVEASCRYADCRHVRSIEIQEGRLIVIDTVDAPGDARKIAQYWHPGIPVTRESNESFLLGTSATLMVDAELNVATERGGVYGWISSVYGSRTEADVIRGEYQGAFPVQLRTEIVFNKNG